MKAFSFSSILKNFGKQLSSLASQMPWCNLRFNLGSMSVLSRVSRPFSRTSLGASFGTSRRASHFAAILTILFTIGVGNVWGEETVLFSSMTSNTKDQYFKDYTVAENTVSVSTSQNVSQSSGDYYVSLSSTPSNANSYYVEVKVTAATIKSVSFALTGNGENKQCQPAILGWKTEVAENTSDYVQLSQKTTVSNKGVANAQWFTFDVSGEELSIIRLYRTVKGVAVNGASAQTYGNGQTIQFYGVRIELESNCTTQIEPTLTYDNSNLILGQTITANPTLNKDGSEGAVTWTSSDEDVASVNSSGVVTAVGAGSATITATIAANGGKCEGTATANFTVTRDPVGEDHVITYIAQTGTGVSATLGTESKTSTSSYLTSLSDLTLNGLTISDAGKENSTPKIQTPGSEDASKYLYLTFNVASGYQFTITQISTKLVAVTDAKTVKCEISDNNGGTTQSLSYSHSKDSDPGTVHNFAFMSNNTYSGTVTVKLYVYGATSTYRLGKPLTITGDVEEKATPSCTAPTSVTIDGAWGKFGGETISLTATATGGSGNYTYQWKHNGENIEGATSATYTKDNCTLADAGNYTCVVSTGETCSKESSLFGLKVYTLECYTDGVATYNFVREGTAMKGSVQVPLTNNKQYEFKINAGGGAEFYFGNNGTINADISNWTFEKDKNNVKLNSGLGGTFVFTIDYTDNGNVPKISVTYPRKTIYMKCGSTWCDANPTFFVHTWGNGDYDVKLIPHSCESDVYIAENVPAYNSHLVFTRQKPGSSSLVWEGENFWNKSQDITIGTNDQFTCTGWDNGLGTFSGGTYSPTTYTVTAAASTAGYGMVSAASVTGVACGTSISASTNTLSVGATNITATPASATAEYTYAFDNWAWTPAGATVTSNVTATANFTRTPKNYTLTWNLAGGKVTEAGTGAAVNATGTPNSEVAFGTAITAPTVTKTGYNFSAWSSSVASTMPAANTTYTATWTAKTTTITINANTDHHGSTAPSTITAMYGSALPSFTAATGASGYSLIGYFTAATSGTKVINADGMLVASTDYADGSGKWKSEDATLTLFAQYEKEVSCTGDPTALVSGTLYQVSDMASACLEEITSTGQYFYGLSSNGKFYINGTTNSNNASTGTVEIKTASNTIDEINFKGIAWFKGAGTNMCRSIKFVVPSAGTLTIYGKTSSDNGNVVIKTESSGNTTVIANSVNAYASGSTTVSAGTYYVLSDGGSAAIVGLKFVESACSTPAAPTGFTAESITSTGATFTIIDAGDAASYDIYYSTSSTAPAEGTAATTTSTSKTKDVTGLTASTTYYAWVRSVCDDTHKSSWFAGSSFTTSAAETPIITWEMKLTSGQNWGLNGDPSTTDNTNITSISANNTHAAQLDGKTANGTMTAGCTTAQNGTARDNNIYVEFKFNVGCDKKLTPSKISLQVSNIGGSSDGNMTYDAILTDGTRTVSGSVTPASDGMLTTLEFTNADASKYMQGDVTLRVYPYNNNGGNTGSGFRMGQYVKIFGEIANQATPAATITWTTQPANGTVGDADFAYAVSCSDGSAVTVTSANDAVATIVDGKLHYEAAGTTHLVATATDACGNEITQNSNDFTVTAASVDPDPEPEPSGCITITDFDGTQNTSANGKPDANAKYLYGYTDANKTPEYAYTITTNKSNNVGKNDGAELYLYYGTSVNIYADNTTTGGTPQDFSGITYISIDVKMVKSSYYSSFDIKVGDKVIADDISLEGTAQSNYVTFEYNVSNLDGKVTIIANGSSTNHHIYVDNIKICTTSLPPCTTPVLEDLSAQTKCPGEDVSWTASNTEALQDGETIAYQWTKKGNATILSPTATLTLNDVTEATGGTYVVTATVSADGKASKTASKEVTLTVTPATVTPTITASASTVYAGNSVTLTATCASSGVGYQWYTCTDADGTNPQAIDGATNATYTLTAGEAGTYYYKVIVTGDGTHSCGTAEKVYTLVVSTSNSGETTCGEITGQFTNGAYTFDTDFIIYGVNSGGNLEAGASSSSGNNRCGGSGRYLGKQRFVVTFPVDVLSFSFMGYQSSDRTIENVKTTAELLSENTEYQTIKYTSTVTKENNCQTHVITPETAIPANTFVWVELSNGLNISDICYVPVSNVNCTDPEVIATVDNATVCEDTENVTFTATNYADGAEFQWQKKDGNTWSPISGAISDTYIISPVTTEHAGQYRVIATKECSRTSEEVTLTVLTAPEFNAFANTASVMKGNALTINDVEATNATDYTWYKSADATYDAGTDTKVGTTKELLLAASSITEEADQTFYLFCVASNSCGSVTSNAITVTVTPFVEEECATAGNEDEYEFGFTNTSCSEDTYGDSKTPVWKTSSRSKYLTYTAPEGKYFATAKVTVAHTGGTKCGYAYSTNGGTTWVVAELGGLSATLTAITIELPANVNAFRISRNLTAQDGEKGSDSGNFYLSEACFTYENACTPTSVTPTTTSYEYNMSVQMGFVEPTIIVKHGEEVVNDAVLTYTSSNPAIATVDEEGSVTFEGMTGTVTITAAYAGATIDEIEYCASEGSYTITVLCEDEEPKIIVAAGTNLDGCNNSITLEAKMQNDNSFTGGTYQWYRDGEAIEGATSASYTVVRAGTYTVSRTYTCTTMSSNSAVVTNENPEPKVERLTPFQYYHVNKEYSDQMKDRHLFAVTSYGTLDGKRYHLTATRNGDALVLSSSTAFFTTQSSDNAVDTVMIDLNELKGKYSANDEIVITCAPINNCNQVSTITSSITIHVIGEKPTLALICSGANGDGTRDTEKLVVGGDFLTGYNKADLCQQTGNKTFDPNIEWGFYEALQDSFIVTPVNGYAQFNKLNYEPFDILLLTDYPKSSKSEAAQKIIDDMADLCDYRPLLSFKTHFQSDKWKDKTTGEYKYTKWVKKGFTTAPVVPKQTATYVNIVCYAHPMFEDIDDINDQYTFHDHDDPNQLVYQVLTGPGYEGSKGIQGFELADADNFVTIGLVHYNAIADSVTHDGHTHISWNAEANDRLLVAMAERQTNIEARMMLFSLNCGAQSLQTPGGRNVILKCLEYLLETDPLKVADCRFTFDNGAGNTDFDPENYEGTGVKGDSLWSTAANWGPDYIVVPGRNNDVRIAAPCIVDGVKTKVSAGDEVQETIQYYPEVLSIHITENGSLTIPANSSLTARSTILRADENGNVYPTNVADISLGSNADGNASLILNNERGDTKAGVAMYSKAKAGTGTTWQYIGTPHSDVSNATYNYYDSWIYSWNPSAGWEVVPTGGAVYPWVGYCITHPEQGHTYWMEGTLVETTTQEIEVPSNSYQIIGNSWTAPIQIANFEEEDFENIETKTIYFFNTGSDPEGDNDTIENATGDARYETGTYIPVPIHAADYRGDVTHIPSMQGFYVANNNPTSAGTLHLDYERHVRAPRKNTPSGPMHAPARINAKDDEPIVAKLLVCGKRYDDKLILLEREDFTGGYDSGWDGDKWDGGTISPTIWAVNEIGGADAVAAIPEFEGTVIGFRAGEDNIYTIHFDYDGMEEALYLLDTETKIYTRVLKGNSYTFACPDKAEHNRFILTRKAPQIATGTENIATGENAKAVKFIKDDKIFIFVNGILYDATGKMVVR